MHIDEWIDDYKNATTENVKYAKAFFELHRLPAMQKGTIEPILKQHKLFCIYKEKTYRVTGASRMGDIWLNENLEAEMGYDLRIDVDEVTKFMEKLE